MPSQFPPPGQAVAGPRSTVVVRPTGLKVVSLLSIAHASLLLMGVVLFGVMWLGGDARIAIVTRTLRQSPVLWSWTLFALATSFVLGWVLLYNAVGALSLTLWSQRTTKLWAIVWLALASVALIVNLGWIYPMLKEASPGHFTFGRLLLVTWLHIAIGIIWPAIVLFYMHTRRVKRAYEQLAGGAATM